jgi:hypothetical protein
MIATKNSLRCYESKYKPSSALIIALYGLNFCLSTIQDWPLEGIVRNASYIKRCALITPYLPPYLHIYHICRSTYDRYYFDSRVEDLLKFFKDEYFFKGNKYCITRAEKQYGLSIIDLISVIGLFSTILSAIPATANGEHYNFFKDAKLYSTYAKYAVLGLSAVDILFGSSDAYFQINYNLSSPVIAVMPTVEPSIPHSQQESLAVIPTVEPPISHSQQESLAVIPTVEPPIPHSQEESLDMYYDLDTTVDSI